jgi:predicted AAA+ superfamily ATPase
MLKRLCRLPAARSVLLLGPRQTGKSTLVRGLLPRRSWSVDLLHQDAFLRYSKEPERFRLEVEAQVRAGTRVVFVDEIQRVPALLEEIHGLIEAHRIRFLLTGSSARKLRRGAANLLAGRAATRRLHPLTLAEQGERFDLDRTLRYGSLPAVVTGSERDARELLTSYAETYLREEVQAEALVRNLGGFARFLDVVAAENGGIVNASAVARDASLSPRTVQEYYQILEDTLIGYRLEAWRRSPRARLVGHPRFYLFDTGVTNALARRLGAPPDPVWRGRLFEQWVVLECARLLDYRRSEARLYYWRTHSGAEVDLLVEQHGRLRLAVEVKAKKTVAGADLSGLRSFAEAHPDVRRVVVAEAPEPYRLGDVDVLPYRLFFDRLPRLLR